VPRGTSFGDGVPPDSLAGGGGVSMHRPILKRTISAAALSLLVGSLVLVGTAPVSAQSKPSPQGIPQQVADLEQKVMALSQQVTTLGDHVNALSLPNTVGGDQLTAFDRRLTTLEERLAGLTPGSGGNVLRVVDANGTEVGPMISSSEVVRKLGDVWLILSVGPSGFVESAPLFYNSSADCSGTRYVGDPSSLIKQAYVIGARIYYAEGNPQPVQVAAWESVSAGTSTCNEIAGGPWTVTLSRAIFSVLPAFSTPFTVQYNQ
jgi:hypothetical protein